VTSGAQAVRGGEVVDARQACAWGFGATVVHEAPQLRCTLVDLDAGCSATRRAEQLVTELLAADDEDRVAVRGDARFVARLIRHEGTSHPAHKRKLHVSETEGYRLEIGTSGVLETLHLERAARRAPGPGEVEIATAASGLNFRDVLMALGIY